MQDHMKQRLIGAITIMSLAVIFLPVIFDGSGNSRLPDIKLDIPARPELIIDQHLEDLPKRGEENIKHYYGEIDLQSFGSGWVAQTGIFADRDSANKHIFELLQHGYKATFRELKNNSGTQYIVEIGPHEHKKVIEDMAQNIKQAMSIEVSVKERTVTR